INFGGQKVTLPIKQVLVGYDGGIVIVDANDEQVSVPSKPTTVIYKDYSVGVDSPAPDNPSHDFRFLDIKSAKALFDLIDNQEPTKQTQRELTKDIKENPLLKKILDDYNNTVKSITNNDWSLEKATIEYNRSKNMIIIRDNAASDKNPRILLIKNVSKIVYANELSTNKNHVFRLVDNNFNLLDLVKNKVDEVINENRLVKSYTIGNATPNFKTKTVSAYSNLNNISAQDTPYPDYPNTYVINYTANDSNNTNKALFVYDLTQVVKTEPSFTNFVLLHNQIKALGSQRTFNDINKITNPELKSVVKGVFGDDKDYNKLQATHYNGYLLFVLFNELNNPIKVLSVKLPKLIDQNDITLPTKDDIINSTLSVNELILNSFKDNNKYPVDSNGLINIDGLKVNPQEIDVVINDDNTISIIKANTDPAEILARIVADNPQYPKRALIDSKATEHVNERNPEAIYELVQAINKLSFGEPTEVKLAEQMIQNSYLKNKLMSAFEDDDIWFNFNATTIRYDIENNRISIDNNNPNNAKILVINNVDRVIKDYENPTSFLFEPQDIIRAFNIDRARLYRENKLTSDQLILGAIARSVARKDLSSPYNYYKLELKNDGVITKVDLNFIPVDDPTITRNKDAQPWKRYVSLKTKNDQEYIIIHDTYYNFSKLDGNEVIKDNTAYKKLVDQILKSNQNLVFDNNIVNKQELDQWLEDIKKDNNINTDQELYLSISAGSNLVLRTENNKHKYFYVLNNVPVVATEKDINLKLPTDEQVLAHNGDYAKAVKAKLVDPNEFPRDENNRINFYNISIDPDKIEVISRDDGSVEFYNQEDGNRIIIAITPTVLPPNYTIDNNFLDDAVLAKEIYQLIKIANAPNKAKPNQKELNQALRSNAWIKQFILDQYSDENNPANIETDFTKDWTIQYYPEKNQVVLRGKNTDQQKRAQVIIINQAIKVINDYELYSVADVLGVDNSIEDKLAHLINQKIKNLNRVGEYELSQPAVVSETEYNNKHAINDPKQNAKYKQIRLANNQLIVVIDNNKYLPFANGKSIFKNPLKQLELENLLKSKAKVGFDLIDKNTKQPINEELFKHLKDTVGLTESELKNTTVSIQDGFIMVSGTRDDGSRFVQKIDFNPNVVSKESIPFVSIDDVIKADGDLGAAYLKLLNDPNKYPLDSNGMIEVNGVKIDPKNAIVEVDPNTNDLLVYEKQKDGSIKLATTIVYKTNVDEVSVKYTVAEGQDIYHAYLQDMATRIKTVEMKVENKSPEALKVVHDILKDPIIKSYLPTGFNISDLVTVEFDNTSNKIIIRDNDSNKPHVVIIKTSILQNAPVQINDQVAYNANIDYWMIIVSVVSLIAGIGLIGLIAILAIRFKNKRRTK
ncbi:GUMAP protein, partial [Ureaplasma diversum]|uniref:GUMAP protein n=1 Tax=Ureaplasma diversum TaxID=42094 RepID=UPI0012DED6D1